MAGKGETELRLNERQLIEELSSKGFSTGGIAKALERSHSCIKGELRKNGGRKNYNATNAQSLANARREAKILKISKGLSAHEIKTIDSLIHDGKSINQIRLATGITHYRLARHIKQNHDKYKRKNLLGMLERLDQLEFVVEVLIDQVKEITRKLSDK